MSTSTLSVSCTLRSRTSFRGFSSPAVAVILAALIPHHGPAQTTQGIITGQVYDAHTGQSLDHALVAYYNLETEAKGATETNQAGLYVLPLLSPGIYSLRVTRLSYQPQETYEIRLFVAGRVEVDFPMRAESDVFGNSLYMGAFLPNNDPIIHFYATDFKTTRSATLTVLSGQAGTLQSTLSYTIDPQQTGNLPLSGRDVYTLLITLPGVTADNATARGLGLSINGQRVSSSNFLLDGLENNNYLLSGPLTVIAPEAVQEYRVSTNNYSAEYGRTGGFVANAITRAGSNSMHGLAYSYIGNSALNANSFQHNAEVPGLPRTPQRETHAGFWLGGPIVRKRLFFSTAVEWFRSRSQTDPGIFLAPVLDRFRACTDIAPNSQAISLLTRFAGPRIESRPLPPGQNPCAPSLLTESLTTSVPVSVDRTLGLQRLDYSSPDGQQKLMWRISISRVAQPDFIPSLYPDFRSPFHSDSKSVAVTWVRSFSARLVNELSGGWRNGDLGWRRPHPEIPSLLSSDGAILPGSGASYEYRNNGNYWEFSDRLVITKGNHMITAGGGLLLLRSGSLLSYARDGLYQFFNVSKFGMDTPFVVAASFGRESQQPLRYDQSYSNNQFFSFLQDNLRLNRRLGINVGARYESFGSPKNTGVQDGFIHLGPGSFAWERLARASLAFENDHQVYRPDRNNWAGRLGLSYDLASQGRTVLRAAYGLFYDRLYDNLTQNTRNNNFDFVSSTIGGPFPYLDRPVQDVLSERERSSTGTSKLYWVDENLRTPYVQSWFAGLQHHFSRSLYFEISHMGALGRKLITSDQVNRIRSVSRPDPNDDGRLNPALPDIVYLSNSGSSNYTAGEALARYRSTRAQFQIAYTFSHSIDNQSEPLVGDFFDLAFINITQASGRRATSAFTRQFDSRVDRASSDFDQRHNLVFYSIWDLPGSGRRGSLGRILGGWQLAQVAGFRSGFPYTVFAPGEDSLLIGNRADLSPGQNPKLPHPEPVPGGIQILNPNAFKSPPPGKVGNMGRNSLAGPGFWNIDVSIAKSFSVKKLGEAGRIQFRADAFNLLNHTNLGNPDSFMPSAGLPVSSFGQAKYGRTGASLAFPATVPLNESPRQVQLQVKLYF